MTAPIRFALQLVHPMEPQQLRDTVRKGEDLGYSTVYVPDHFVEHPMAPFPTCVAVAAATTTLRVGTLVLGNDYRHPVVTATDAATVDLLSGGRLELGVGAGWMRVDYDKAGMPYDPAAERIERLAESVTVLKGLFAEGEFSFAGNYYTIDSLDGQPKPTQRPHPPLVIGGGGPRILALAAREADIVGINARLHEGMIGEGAAKSVSGSATDQKVQWVRDAAGDRFDQLELQSLVGFVLETDDREGVAEQLAAPFGVSAELALETPFAFVGTVQQMIDDVFARRDRWSMTYHVVPINSMETFAPVVAATAGK